MKSELIFIDNDLIKIIFATIFLSLVVLFCKYMTDKQMKREDLNEELRKKAIQQYRIDNNVPTNADMFFCEGINIKEQFLEGKWDIFIWKENESLIFCGATEKDGIEKTTISIENVKFFTRKGDYRIETVTEYGGIDIFKAIIGGLIGAIIGGVLGGVVGAFIVMGVGAILAGRNKVTTSNKTIDDRKVYLHYLENNKEKRMIFISRDYDILLKIIPEKEISYIENNKSIETDNLQSVNDNIYKDIEKLAELRDKGILTEEEFNYKKKLLLNRI